MVMKLRWAFLVLIGLTAANTGCYCHHPCWGFRLHPCATPACYYPPRKPLLHHKYYKFGYPFPPVACDACFASPSITTLPAAPTVMTFPTGAYPPIVGQPTPLPGPGPQGTPMGSELPHPMPMKKDAH
jgi:hypothetical protein